MRFAVDVPNFGDFADPRLFADLARRAEEAGWDGLFVWDHVTHSKEMRRHIADPWVLLTAAADMLASLAAAGVTWWEECDLDHLEQAAPMFRRVDQGPPCLS